MQPASSNSAIKREQEHLRAQLAILQNHDNDEHSASPPASRSPNGYDDQQFAPQQHDSSIHPDLREAQLHAQAAESMMQMGPPGSHSPNSSGPSSNQPPLAPAPPPIPDSVDRKPKRELSQSKRAAQNRAAQRAFRQRKEGYIKKLEQQVREFGDIDHTFKQLQAENYALREYVLHLQSRLIETAVEVPPPPANVNLNQGDGSAGHLEEQQQQSAADHGAGTPLEAVAKAVAGLAAQEQLRERQEEEEAYDTKMEAGDDDTRSADEINRHLNPDEVGEQV